MTSPRARTPFTIMTYTGQCVDPRNLLAKDVSIQDIQHALAHTCRFGGHVPRFYSVAQHSVLVSRWLDAAGFDTQHQLAGLLHDAGEAYSPDICRPLKRARMCKELVQLERDNMETILDVFGVHPSTLENWDAIGDADNDLLSSECICLWNRDPHEWGLPRPTRHFTIDPLPPVEAKVQFENRFHNLMLQIKEEGL
jgi:hypothetical protein